MGIPSDPDKPAKAESSTQHATKQPEKDPEIAGIRDQLSHGNLDGLREYLRRTRETHDWQDRIYVLNCVVDELQQATLSFACEKEPDAADLALIYTAYYSDLAAKRRGQGTCDEIEEAQIAGAAEAIRAAIPAVQASIKLDPEDPTSRAVILGSLTIFGELRPTQQQFFEQIVELDSDCAHAYDRMAHSLSKRWHGSHEESLAVARAGIAKATKGSDVAGALFRAHDLVKGHLQYFDEDIIAAAKYVQDPDVIRELTEAFDRWTGSGYVPRRSSVERLKLASQWFWAFNDRERLARAKSLIETASRSFVQGQEQEEKQEGIEASQSSDSDQAKECLDFVSFGAKALKDKRPQEALGAFLGAGKIVKVYRLDSSLDALVRVHLALACSKQGAQENSRKILAEGMSIADQADFSKAPTKLLHLMASALEELDANRAIPFFELLIQSGEDNQDPLKIASLLNRMGRCYLHMGLRDQAAIPLRAAVRLYRSSPASPQFPSVLLDLGSALSKSAPAEAEALYREAAGLHEAQMKIVSATPVWVNLGLLCSEQGRNQEAMELYQKVLNIREKTPNVAPSRIASVLNNMAVCYRRMKRFDEAHAAIDRAILLTGPGEPAMASYYGTRGEIFCDQSDLEHSLEWTRKAIAIREKQTSPKWDALAENYEKEIEALEKLGCVEEVEQVRVKLAKVRASIQAAQGPELDSATMSGLIAGAVFVELPFGASTMTSALREGISAAVNALSAKVREEKLGRFDSRVTVPEHTTLIFYGSNAELLYTTIHPILIAERVCAGARVVIQQNGATREHMVSAPRTSIN